MSTSMQDTENPVSTETPQYFRDEIFYFNDLTFLVEETLFCVPRQYFEHTSEAFSDMFQLPVAEGESADGSCIDQPLHLQGIAKRDFRQLLKALLPTDFCPSSAPSVMQWSVDARIADGRDGQSIPMMNSASECVDGVSSMWPGVPSISSYSEFEPASSMTLMAGCGEMEHNGGESSAPGHYSNIKRDLPTMPWEEWASVLKLSTMWQMEEIRQTAFGHVINIPNTVDEWVGLLRLETSSGIPEIREIAVQRLNNIVHGADRVELALEFGIEGWLMRGYQQLVEQTDPISEADEARLGRETVTKLFKLRHRRLQGRQGYGDSDIRKAICRDMKVEMEKYGNPGSQATEALQSDTMPDSGKAAVEKDQSFYLTSVVFLVENTLFRVPRGDFERNSEVFRDMFKVASGSSDSQPFHLDGIAKTDFRQLLKVMFPMVTRNRNELGVSVEKGHDGMSWNDWSSVFKLSNMWQMRRIRDKALERISVLPANADEWIAALKLSTTHRISSLRRKAIEHLGSLTINEMDRIKLAVVCKEPEWLLRGYRQLVERYDDLSAEEEEGLGWNAVSKLFRIRDKYLSVNPRGCRQFYDPLSDVRRAFQVELNEISTENWAS